MVIPYRRFVTTGRFRVQWTRNQRRWLYFLTLEDGTDWLYRNVGKKLPVYTASYPRKGQNSKQLLVAYPMLNMSQCLRYSSFIYRFGRENWVHLQDIFIILSHHYAYSVISCEYWTSRSNGLQSGTSQPYNATILAKIYHDFCQSLQIEHLTLHQSSFLPCFFPIYYTLVMCNVLIYVKWIN